MLSYLQEKELLKISSSILSSLPKNNPSFESILPIISNKEFILNNQKLLQILNLNLHHKKIKSFLTCIMIKYCPNEIFSEQKELENRLIAKSNEMFELFTNFLNNCLDTKLQSDFVNNIQTYIDIFEAWRNNDQKKLIVILASSYHDLCLTSDYIKHNDNNAEWLDGIEKQKKSLEKAIYKIGGEDAINKLMDGSFWLELMTPEFKESIEKNIKIAFFNKLKDELQLDKTPFMTIKCLTIGAKKCFES